MNERVTETTTTTTTTMTTTATGKSECQIVNIIEIILDVDSLLKVVKSLT